MNPANAFDDEAFSITFDELIGNPITSEFNEAGEERSVYEPARQARASEFVDLVTGRVVPVAAELERFLAARSFSSRYVCRIKRAVGGLSAWLAERGKNHIAQVTRYNAGLYVEHLSATHNTAQTVSSLVTALSSYWRWMVRRGAAAENPWANQAPEERSSDGDAEKRAYTDHEIKALLSGDTYGTLHDMMRIAALSGMRINEIGRLTVADCSDEAFNIREAKTSAGVRRVPIHSALGPLIERRSKGKGPDEHLIEELTARKDHTGDRAGKASERFTAYRRGLGVDERKAGQRQSNVDFHSFRRWFITKAERAGQPPHVISAVVGHSEGRQGMTLGRYSEGPSLDQMREVVEAVCLPGGTLMSKTHGRRMGDGRWPAP